ncbi:methyltransferase domain-containing protein [Elioraea sp. Yellowstone]|jgi:SAM-dependent methyltransferase|uniref:class I SAM-dependent methyltransferase n=1 Tax=Elioraea sp. Yellowstone TaxID=2592070 RepID=UPI001153E1FE|nr:class I SAM-dependent methyltransferase [Elioraea sp. Yellowstone]TQF76358.1 methyltransferase domain-containing protein [Elioraea sp. Yellowstone]
MSGWSGGYVSDIDYLPWFFPLQAPAHLGLALAVAGVEHAMAAEDFAFCDLGCGVGLTAGAIAAANPRARVWAVDFNPGHIALARALATEAGLANIAYIEADFAELAAAPPPEMPRFDCVSLHGVWAWVSDATRAAIVRFLARQVKPGGVVHVGYNALPGWQEMMGLRRLLAEVGATVAGRSDRRIEAAMAVARDLNAANARHLKRSPFVQRVLSAERSLPAIYLAHEYLNENWRPMFHAEVAAALAEAKLSFAAAAELPENFPDLCLDEAQRAVIERLPTEAARETAKDLCVERAFRHDIFVRGPRPLTPARRHTILSGAMLAAVRSGEDPVYEVEVPGGKATLSQAAYEPVFAALAERPRTAGELAAIAGQGGTPTAPAEILAMLIASRQAVHVAFPEAAPAEAARRWGAALARRFAFGEPTGSLVLPSPRLGNGLPAYAAELQVYAALSAGCAPEPGMVADWIVGEVTARGEHVTLEGRRLAPDEARASVAETAKGVLDHRLAVWRRLAIV